MGRHIKIGLDYMTLDCDVLSNRKTKLFLSDFPIEKQYEVFGIWVTILLKLYATTGYYLSWNEEDCAIFSRDFQIDKSYLDEIVKRAIHRGLFNKERYEERQVLTSAEITERYVFAKSGHFSGIIDTTYGILRETIPIDTETIAISTLKSAQRKEKNTRPGNRSEINSDKSGINNKQDSDDFGKTCPNGHRYTGSICRQCIADERKAAEDDIVF